VRPRSSQNGVKWVKARTAVAAPASRWPTHKLRPSFLIVMSRLSRLSSSARRRLARRRQRQGYLKESTVPSGTKIVGNQQKPIIKGSTILEETFGVTLSYASLLPKKVWLLLDIE